MTSRAGPEINLAFKEMITNLVLASRVNCQGSSTKMGPCSCQYCAVQLWCFHLADLWYKYQNNMINIPFKDNSIHINNSCCSLSFLFLNKMINCKQAKSPTLLVPILLSLTWSNWDYCNSSWMGHLFTTISHYFEGQESLTYWFLPALKTRHFVPEISRLTPHNKNKGLNMTFRRFQQRSKPDEANWP